MTVQECYEKIGGNYEDIMRRMMKEERVVKFVTMFLQDDNYQKLLNALQEKNIKEAFAAAHTLKGVTANLSLDRLNKSTVEITEALRGEGDIELAQSMLSQVMDDYELTVAGIEELIG